MQAVMLGKILLQLSNTRKYSKQDQAMNREKQMQTANFLPNKNKHGVT
jgi:hypothetical protein